MRRKESLPAINLIQKQGMCQSKVAFNLCTDNRLERRDSYFFNAVVEGTSAYCQRYETILLCCTQLQLSTDVACRNCATSLVSNSFHICGAVNVKRSVMPLSVKT